MSHDTRTYCKSGFAGKGSPSLTIWWQFAIRTTIRNHHAMKSDDVIKRVADLVGQPHTVDLKKYDRLVLVDVYRVSIKTSLSFIEYLVGLASTTTSDRFIYRIY